MRSPSSFLPALYDTSQASGETSEAVVENGGASRLAECQVSAEVPGGGAYRVPDGEGESKTPDGDSTSDSEESDEEMTWYHPKMDEDCHFVFVNNNRESFKKGD